MNLTYNMLMFIFIMKLVSAYTNNYYTIVAHRYNDDLDADCGRAPTMEANVKRKVTSTSRLSYENKPMEYDFTFETMRTTTRSTQDPLLIFENMKLQVIYGSNKKEVEDAKQNEVFIEKLDTNDTEEEDLDHYPSGNIMRADLFQNNSAVHLPMSEMMHRNHMILKLTDDYMQTAIDAFSIFLEGSMEDVIKLPSSYVLQSARTIAMMNIAKEKLVATWLVVRGDFETHEVPYQVLAKYRPLFKYVSAREIARLNLSDERILSFVGTHTELDRHQVGVVASRYIQMNPHWSEPHYLNLMNNLLCGVPMSFMRKIPEANYLQLSRQVFHHIKACDPLQRRFYLTMMTKTQALGKSYSWAAQDVARLGLLLTEVDGHELAAVNPEAMSGITAQVMLEIPERNLMHITDMQLRFLGQQPLNILAKKMKIYHERLVKLSYAAGLHSECLLVIILTLSIQFAIK